MPSGNKSKTFTSSTVAKSRSSNRSSASRSKKKKVKRSAKSKHIDEQDHARCCSPLVYNPEIIVQELMQKYQKIPQELGLKEISKFELERNFQLIVKQSTEEISINQKKQRNQGLAIRMGLSNQISCFELPMDVKQLESMTVQEYLRNYCRVCKRRQNYYKKFFDKFDRDRDGFLSKKETEAAFKEIYFNEINMSQINDLMSLITAEENTSFDSKLFFSTCALSERFFYASYVTEEISDEVSEKQWIETADFSAIKWKLAGCDIKEALKRLLITLLNTHESR